MASLSGLHSTAPKRRGSGSAARCGCRRRRRAPGQGGRGHRRGRIGQHRSVPVMPRCTSSQPASPVVSRRTRAAGTCLAVRSAAPVARPGAPPGRRRWASAGPGGAPSRRNTPPHHMRQQAAPGHFDLRQFRHRTSPLVTAQNSCRQRARPGHGGKQRIVAAGYNAPIIRTPESAGAITTCRTFFRILLPDPLRTLSLTAWTFPRRLLCALQQRRRPHGTPHPVPDGGRLLRIAAIGAGPCRAGPVRHGACRHDPAERSADQRYHVPGHGRRNLAAARAGRTGLPHLHRTGPFDARPALCAARDGNCVQRARSAAGARRRAAVERYRAGLAGGAAGAFDPAGAQRPLERGAAAAGAAVGGRARQPPRGEHPPASAADVAHQRPGRCGHAAAGTDPRRRAPAGDAARHRTGAGGRGQSRRRAVCAR